MNDKTYKSMGNCRINIRNFWVITFGLIAIVFNPLIPIYLNDKSAWMPIDIIGGIIFVIKSFTLKQKIK